MGGGGYYPFWKRRMNTKHVNVISALLLLTVGGSAAAQAAAATDPLPSWNKGTSKQAIIEFVERVTNGGNPGFVPPAERIATFDNDGCLWSEQPMYFQALFALDRVKELSADHPEWKTTEPFKSAIASDLEGVMAGGMEGLAKIIATSHADITADAFSDTVEGWLATARHPKTGKLYVEMVFQPMLELLEYLRENDFKTFIVSGGGIDFLRVFAEEVYGVPPQQVIGTTLDAKFETRDGVPTIVKEGKLVLLDDKEGKPVGIYRHIGRRPICAAGNSDGDQQMLQYTTIARDRSDDTPRFGLIVHHTDAEREWAYDRKSHIGKLDKALDEAGQRGWIVVDMKNEWKVVYPDQP